MPQEGYPNLIGPGDKTPDELREQTRKAGQASGVSRRRRKTFAEGLKQLLEMPEDDPKMREALQALGLDGTIQDAINIAQIRQAKKGDVDSFRIVRDTVGEKPRDEMDIGGVLDRPLATVDMSKLSDDQLRMIIASKSDD